MGACSSEKPLAGSPIRIVSGSENEALKPLLDQFTKETRIPVEIQFKGSVDIMLLLQLKEIPFDAVWPANSLWIDLSGNKRVKHAASITRSPVVIGIKKSKADALQMTGKPLKIRTLAELAGAGKLNFIMSNPTQSNSGAMGYLGFLQGILGKEEVMTIEDLMQPKVQQQAKVLLKAIARTSGSSGWLKDLMVKEYDQFDAMVNYEATVIEANQELERLGKEPMIVFYPEDGQAIADSPLAWIDQGAAPEKEQAFLRLQQYLLSPAVQQQLAKLGRRTGLIGSGGENPGVFRADWGLDVQKILQPIPTPSSETIRKALSLYQTALKKPSLTAFVLDFSGSMYGDGEEQLKEAMALLLSEKAGDYFLESGGQDVTIVVPFEGHPRRVLTHFGNDPKKMAALLEKIRAEKAQGSTNIYEAVKAALEAIGKVPHADNYQGSVILMTDGKSEGSLDIIMGKWNAAGNKIPVFSIMFGEADPSQLKKIAHSTGARVFDGKGDLIHAFRNAKGYN